MKFTPKTPEEVKREEQERKLARLLPEGVYDFEVTQAEDQVSKKGNEMIHLTLRVYSAEGHPVLIDDWLLEAMAHKLRHFADATGLTATYDTGNLTAFECVGVCGKVKIKQEKKGEYDPKCVVRDYVVSKDAKPSPRPAARPTARPSEPPPPEPYPEDDIPF